LRWLLLKPAGLSISTRDDAVRKRTIDVMLALIDQCAELGGRYLVHGSPHQRRVDPGETRAAALARAQESFAAVAGRAEKAGVVYCIEALSAEQTPLINTLGEEIGRASGRERGKMGGGAAEVQKERHQE